MLQTMRNNAQGTIAKVIVGFLIVVFALWGVESIVTIGSGEPAVVEVNGTKITEAEIARVVEQQKLNLMRQFGDQFDANLFNDQYLRDSAIEQLIERTVALVQARELGLVAAPRSIDEIIVAIPAFQVDGKFDRAQFQELLRTNGLSPLMFRNSLAEDMIVDQASAAFALTTFKTPFAAQLATALDEEQRTFRFVEVNARSLEASVTLTEEEIQNAYADMQSRFITPEKMSVSYVAIKRSDLVGQQTVSDDEIVQAYEQYKSREALQEQRKASHILLETSDRSLSEAKALAAELKQRLNNGEAFEVLAAEYSDDIGTKSQGGDLGINQRGIFVDEFEDVLYRLNKGQISEPVETEFGVHLIRVDDIVAANVKSLNSMRGELTNAVRENKAYAAYNEKVGELAPISFSAQSLEEVAQSIGGKVETTALFTRDAGDGVAVNPQIRDMAFSDVVLFDNEISSVVELDGIALVLVKNEHQPESVLPLADVRSQVVAALKRERALELAKVKADDIAAGTETSKNWKTVTTSYANNSVAPRAAQQRAFALVVGQSSVVGTPGGYTVVALEDVDVKDWQEIEVFTDAVELGRAQNSRADLYSYHAWSRSVSDIER